METLQLGSLQIWHVYKQLTRIGTRGANWLESIVAYLKSISARGFSKHSTAVEILGSGTHPQPLPVYAQQARVAEILKARRHRAEILGPDLFADPAWDMLLELYAAHLGQFELSVSSLCLSSGVPVSTALRWMGEMEKRGLFERRPDRADGRRVLVRMSDMARERMDQLFEQFPTSERFT